MMDSREPERVDLVAAYLDHGACLMNCMTLEDWIGGRRFTVTLKSGRGYRERHLWAVPIDIAGTLLRHPLQLAVNPDGWRMASLAGMYTTETNDCKPILGG